MLIIMTIVVVYNSTMYNNSCIHIKYVKLAYVAANFLQWLEKEFVGYLAEWDAMVEAREQFSAAEKKMKLSQDTLEGLRMTGMRNVMYIHAC